jgi:hypothetical protein
MLKSAMVLILAFSLAACSKDDDGNKKKGGNGGGGIQPQGWTDTSICTGPSPANYSLLSKRWKIDTTDNKGIKYLVLMTFGSNSWDVSVTCSNGDLVATAVAHSNASINSTSFQATTNDNQSATAYGDDGSYLTCYANITAGRSYTYAFQGPCLKVLNSDLMIPAD